jgi:hypothetical protein
MADRIVGAILAAMERIRFYFDRWCKKQPLDSGIVQLPASSFCLAICLWLMAELSSHKDHGGFYLGIGGAVVSLLNIFISYQSIHAVVRRLVAEARKLS